jgi:phospholipase C
MARLRKASISTAIALIVMLTSMLFQATSTSAAGLNTDRSDSTATPIKHVIVIIGENHTFDNIFGTFQPGHGQSVNNLLSQGMVTCSGNLGQDAGLAAQQQATDTTTFSLAPQKTGPYATLPQPNTTSARGQPPNVPDQRYLYTLVHQTAGDDNGAIPPKPIYQGASIWDM